MRDEKPPLFNRWSSWYWLVLAVMGIQVILFLWLTLQFT